MEGATHAEPPPRTTRRSRTQELMDLIRSLSQERGPEHPMYSPPGVEEASPEDVQRLASNALAVNEILQFLRGVRERGRLPREGSQPRRLYDAALALGGEEGLQGAIDYLDEQLADTIGSLRHVATSRAVFGDQAEAFQGMLVLIDSGVQPETLREDSTYAAYVGVRNDISTLLRVFRQLSAVPRIAATDEAVTRAPPPILEVAMPEAMPVHVLLSTADERMEVVGLQSTRGLNAMFGDPDLAEAFLLHVAQAYNARAMHPNDAELQREIMDDLRADAGRIPEGRDIRDTEAFEQFMHNITCGGGGGCDLGAALDAIENAQGSADFAAIRNALERAYILSVTPNTVAVARMGVSAVVYQDEEAVAAFTNFCRGGNESFRHAFRNVAIGFAWTSLFGQAFLSQFAQRPDGTYAIEPVEGVEVTGNVITIDPSVSFAVNAWGTPVVFVIRGSFGYEQWEASTEVETADGGTETIEAGGETGMFRALELRAEFPGMEGERSTVRVEAAGLALERGGPGGAELTSPLAYVLVSGNWLRRRGEQGVVELRSLLQPSFRYLAGRFQLETDLRALEVAARRGNWTVSTHIGARYQLSILPSRGQEVSGVELPREITHTIDTYLGTELTYEHGFTVRLRLGHIIRPGDVSPEEALPSLGEHGMPYGSLDFILTPGRWFGQRRRTRGTEEEEEEGEE